MISRFDSTSLACRAPMHLRSLVILGAVACGLAVVSPGAARAQSAPRPAATDTAAARVASDHPTPRPGEPVRITVPGLSRYEPPLSGPFAGVDSTAQPWTVGVTT